MQLNGKQPLNPTAYTPRLPQTASAVTCGAVRLRAGSHKASGLPDSGESTGAVTAAVPPGRAPQLAPVLLRIYRSIKKGQDHPRGAASTGNIFQLEADSMHQVSEGDGVSLTKSVFPLNLDILNASFPA